MAEKSMVVKDKHSVKLSTQAYTCCERCGRPRSACCKLHLCRIYFRELAYKG